MENLNNVGALLIAYLIGAIPFGFIFVKLRTGIDIRDVQSGRTGGTNAMRAAGFGVGLFTAFVDILKGGAAVFLVQSMTPNPWLHVLAGVAAILGHNYSIFLIQRSPEGKLRLGGGAGGAACMGGSLGLWAGSVGIIFPLSALIFYFVGYASVATMSVAILSSIVFAIRAAMGDSPWEYVAYGILAELLLLWALRPNIKALREGTERIHGFRVRNKKTQS